MQLKDRDLFRQQAYVAGTWMDAEDGASDTVTNPATGEKIGTVPRMGAVETRRAVEAAGFAMKAWAATPAKERAVILRRWADMMVAQADDIGVLMTSEQGKPLAEAKGEVAYAASFIEWFAEQGKRVDGDVLQSPWPSAPACPRGCCRWSPAIQARSAAR